MIFYFKKFTRSLLLKIGDSLALSDCTLRLMLLGIVICPSNVRAAFYDEPMGNLLPIDLVSPNLLNTISRYPCSYGTIGALLRSKTTYLSPFQDSVRLIKEKLFSKSVSTRTKQQPSFPPSSPPCSTQAPVPVGLLNRPLQVYALALS
jgi:hypothetical protein